MPLKSHAAKQIKSLAFDKLDRLWVGLGDNGGLYLYEKGKLNDFDSFGFAGSERPFSSI